MSHITRIERRASEPTLESKDKDKDPSSRKSKSTTVAPSKQEDFHLPERLQALLADDFDHEGFQRKLELLKCRYKHAVKSELISFCYASSDASGDEGLMAQTSRSPEFVRTLMNIVEKDKEIADIAVNLVEEIDLMEKAKVHHMSKQSKGEAEDPLFKAIWDNHEKSRKHVARFLEDERNQIYGHKDVSNDVSLHNDKDEEDSGDESPPVWAKTNIDKWSKQPKTSDPNVEGSEKCCEVVKDTNKNTPEHEMRETELNTGMQKLLNRLGCAHQVSAEASYEQKLIVIQERVRSLKEQMNQLRNMAPVQPALNVASDIAIAGSASEENNSLVQVTD